MSSLLAELLSGSPTAVSGLPVRIVTPDADRRLVTRAEVVAEHFTTTGKPVGHGFSAANWSTGTAYYVQDLPATRAQHGVRSQPVRMIVLDTVNENGEADGSLDIIPVLYG